MTLQIVTTRQYTGDAMELSVAGPRTYIAIKKTGGLDISEKQPRYWHRLNGMTITDARRYLGREWMLSRQRRVP